jgi:long-chain acyl-CoA synthetase
MDQVLKDKGDTWPKVLKYNYEKYGDSHRAMRHKHYGIWQPYTWKDYYLSVKHLALGLLSIGFEPGDKVMIIGDNAPQWYYAELAAQANHGVSVGLYSDLTPREIRWIAEHSEAKFAVVEDQEQVDKFIKMKHELPLLKKIVYWNYKGLAHYEDPMLMGYREILQQGKKYEKEHPGLFEQNVDSSKADDVCALVYTSGTTGVAPRGAIHTYETMRAGADYHLNLDRWIENDNIVPYLPPAWMTEQWFGIGCHLLSASILNFAEGPETQQRDTKEIQPNIVAYSARQWEGQAATVQARIHGSDPLKRFVFRVLMPIGYKMADLRQKREKPNIILRMLYALANLSLFQPLKVSLGLSQARVCYATGAMLSLDAFRFYHALNLPLKSLYGTTEGGALTGAKNEDIRFETVGPAHKGAEMRITDQGELIYRQPGVFIGYYKDQAGTAEVLKDGWFYSGDCGFIREDGHIVFLDRVKDIIPLEGGDKLTPQSIESRLRFSPYIKDAWVLSGPDRSYASAIIIINYLNVGRWAGQRRVAYSTFAELSQKPEVRELVRQYIQEINGSLPPGFRVRKYVNLHKEFDPDEGELTRNRKLRRTFLEERYRELIGAIYAGQKEVTIEAQVKSPNGLTKVTKTILNIQSVEGAAL